MVASWFIDGFGSDDWEPEVLLAAGGYAIALKYRSWPLWLLAFLLTLIAIWVAYFFRDPERTGERGERLVVAPADGKIVQIVEVDEPAFLQSRAIQISIFMNVFNVHVNRYPVSGTVGYVHYNPGKFLNAAADKATLRAAYSQILAEYDQALAVDTLRDLISWGSH